MIPELTVHIFANRKKAQNQFSIKERIVMEDGVTTIRPYRNGKPSSTAKEIDKAFADFRAAIEPTGLFPLTDDDGRVIEFEIDLTEHNRSF